LQVDHKPGTSVRAGFVLRKTTTETAVIQTEGNLVREKLCLLDYVRDTDTLIDLSNVTTGNVDRTVTVPSAGLYDLFYTRCTPEADAPTTFHLYLELVNPGPNYLSAGEQGLPVVYGVFAALFASTAAFWIYHLRANKDKIHSIHHLMTILIVARAASSLVQAIMYASIASSGRPSGWNVLFYILTFFKGSLFFVGILLIGTGWSMLKPYLSDNEKRVLMVVLPLQVLANIASVVVDEIAPGSLDYIHWQIVLSLTEGACCVAVLLPTAWSIKRLSSAAPADGKARQQIDRLTRFRNFFVGTMVFLYCTKFVSYVIFMAVGFSSQWLASFFVEALTLAYYISVGHAFGPAAENPYTRVRGDSGDDEDGEFGLQDTSIDTGAQAPHVQDAVETVAEDSKRSRKDSADD
jgi:G protein-coupled receptor 107